MAEAVDARSEVEIVFDSLLRERGGPAKFDAVSLAAARGLSALLTAGNPSAAALSVLSDLLPPKAEAKPYDIGRLNDKELRLLHHLMSIASGEKRGALPPRSRSELQCQLIGHALARLEAGGCVAKWKPASSGRQPTADEKIEIRSLLDSALLHVGLSGEELYPSERRDRMPAPENEAPVAPADEAPTDEFPSPVTRPSTNEPTLPANVEPLFDIFFFATVGFETV